jgi:predicted CXXCH cytochrome family protein
MWMKRSKLAALGILAGFAFLLISLALAFFAIASPAQASDAPAPPAAPAHGGDPLPVPDPNAQIDNKVCLACHAAPNMTMRLSSGELLFLTVDADTYANSVHGLRGYSCVQCHTNITGYPHPPVTAATRRQFTIQMYTTCEVCHQDKYQATLDSVHEQALAAGNINAAVCTDCHGAHDVQPPDQPRTRIPLTCAQCHSQIYNLYRQSVHGAALFDEDNPDVPTCVDCHGVHNVQGPANSPFRLLSPQICAKCHANKQLMDKYRLNTDVFNTYVADFHGTTVAIFDATAAGQQPNTPVCVDCHGVHDILVVTDQNSTVIKNNLLNTCRKCHPDATLNFPGAWLDHYPPSPTHAPVVYFVSLFYKVFIPLVIGGMLVFVLSDVARRIINRRREQSHE